MFAAEKNITKHCANLSPSKSEVQMSMKEQDGNLLPLAVACKTVTYHIWSFALMIVVVYCRRDQPQEIFRNSCFEGPTCTSTLPFLLPFSAGESEGPLCNKNLCPCQRRASSGSQVFARAWRGFFAPFSLVADEEAKHNSSHW